MSFPRCLFTLFLCLILSSCATQKDWVRHFPTESAVYKYYVGRGSSSKSESDAFNKAVTDAYVQAARENFGMTRQTNSEIYLTTDEESFVERTVEQGVAARFDNFEKIDQLIETAEADFNVWLLFRFSKAAIEKEKARLNNLQGIQEKRETSIVGAQTNAAKGVLNVLTRPADGAAVYIDGERYGQTPLRLIGVLSAGAHAVRIDHPYYKTVSEKVIIVPNQTVTIDKTLIPETVKFTVETTPVNADVYMNGVKKGTAPLNITVPIGKKVLFKFVHPEIAETQMPMFLKKDGLRRLTVTLVEKPAYLSVFSFPAGADVFSDGEKIGTTPLEKYPVSRGAHTLALGKDGYAFHMENWTAAGGEKTVKTIDLKPSEQETFPHDFSALTDKNHRTAVILPPAAPVPFSFADSSEKPPAALMRWNYAAQILKARVSFADNGFCQTKFHIFLSFDTDAYTRLFVDAADKILRRLTSRPVVKKDADADCFYHTGTQTDTEQLACRLQETGERSSVVLRTGDFKHGYWSDKAAVNIYSVPFGKSDFPPDVPRQYIYTATLEITKKDKTKTLSETDFRITLFDTDANGNVIFSPSFAKDDETFLLTADSPVPTVDIQSAVLKISVKKAVLPQESSDFKRTVGVR